MSRQIDAQLITARRTVALEWKDGRQYDLVTGRRIPAPKIAKSPTAYACMHVRGQELANIPWHIKKGNKILEKHPLIDMLEDFGPESNYQKAMLYTEIDMLLYGAALWLRDTDILKRLAPDTIEVKKNNNGIAGFKQTLNLPNGGEKINHYSRDEVIYFREYHPEDDLGFGISAVEVCQRPINAEIEALLMIEAHFKNDAVPGFMLTTDQDVTEKEANRVIAWWNKIHRGSRNKGKVGVAGKGLKPVTVGSNMKESGVVGIMDATSRDICKAFRVDRILIGGNLDATYENLNESRKFLIEDVIMPRAIEYQNVINQDLVNRVDPSVVFEFAFDEIQILQEDSTAKSTRLLSAYQAGLISEDYYREEMGIPQKAKPSDEEAKAKAEKQEAAESKWEKKAVKALLKGESPAVPFETDNISIDRQYVIRGRLMNADSEDAVRACFQ